MSADAEQTAPKRRRRWPWLIPPLALLAIVGGALGLVTTGPGLEVVRGLAQSAANEALRGHLEIGRIAGSALSELIIEDVRLEDRAGRPAITVERLRLAWRPAALLAGRVQVDAIELDAPRVLAITSTTGALNLTELGPPPGPPEPPEDRPPLPLDLPHISLQRLQIRDAGLELRDPGGASQRVDALGVELSAEIDGDEVELRLARLDAGVLEGRALHAEAELGLSGQVATVQRLLVTLDGARVELRDVRAQLPVGPAQGNLRLDLPPSLAQTFGAPEALRAGLDLNLDFDRAQAPVWTTRGEGHLAGAALTVSATVPEDLGALQLDLGLAGLDPHAAHPAAPRGRLALTVDASADASAPAHPKAALRVRIEGRVSPPGMPEVLISPLAVRASLDGDRARADVEGRVANAAVEAHASLSDLSGVPKIDAGNLEVRVPDLAAIVGAQAHGRLALTATAAGSVEDLRAEGELEAAELSWGGLAKVRAVGAAWTLTGLPSAPVGSVDLDVRRARIDGRPIEGLTVALKARQEEGRTRVDAEALRIRTQDLVWRGGGAHLELDPDHELTVQRLGLASSAGKLRLDARVGLREALEAEAQVQIEALTLQALPRGLAPELGALEGRVDLAGAATVRGEVVKAQLTTSVRGARVDPGHPLTDLDAKVRLRPGRLVATATAALDGARAAIVRAAVTPPAQMSDPEAWARALARAPLKEAALDLEQVDLRTVQRFGGQALFTSGTLDGRVRIEGGRSARVTVDVSDARPVDLDVSSSLSVRAGFDPGRAWARGALKGGPWGTGTFTATAAAPSSLFDAKAWARTRPAAVRGARIDVVGTELEVLDRLGLVPGLSGRLDADVRAEAALEAVQARLRITGARLPEVDSRLDAETRVTVQDGLVQDLEASLDGRRVLSTHVETPVALARLLEGEVPDPDALQLRAEVQIDALPLTPFASLARLEPKSLQGSLTASVSVAGRATAPQGQAWLTFDGLRLAKVGFGKVEARAQLSTAQIEALAQIEDEMGGRLNLQARLTDEAKTLDTRITAEGLDLSFISRLGLLPLGLEARLFADVKASGPTAKPVAEGWVEARDMRVVFAQSALQPLHGGLARVDLEPEVAKLALSGAAGGGKLELSAQAELPQDGAPSFTARTRLTRFPVAAGSLVRIDLVAETEGAVEEDATRVKVELTDGFVHVPDEKTDNLHPIAELEDVVYVDRLPGGTGGTGGVEVETASVSAGPPVLVQIRSREPIDVRGGPVDAALTTELDAEAKGGASRITGRAHVTEGAITLFRRRYIIERADLVFEGKDPPDPRVDVRLRHEFDGLSFRVRVRGRAQNPEVEFSSSPARFSKPELLTIFLGTDPEALGQKDDRTVEEQAVGALAGFVVGQLQDQLGKNLPIDTLDVELGDTTNGGAGTRVTLGKWITRKLFLAYRYKFQADTDLENDNEALMQYRFLPGWMVEVVLGLTRNDADIMWTKRF